MIDNQVKPNTCKGIYLPLAVIERADAMARAAGCSRSRLVRILIESANVRPVTVELLPATRTASEVCP